MGKFLTVKGKLVDDCILTENLWCLKVNVKDALEVRGYFLLYNKYNGKTWTLLSYVEC